MATYAYDQIDQAREILNMSRNKDAYEGLTRKIGW